MKKQLLNEQEIRKFMKFAEIGSLADGVIDRLDEGGMMYKDDDPEGALGAAGEGEGEEMGGDMPLPPEGAEDAGLGDEPAGTPEEKLKSILQAMADEAAKQGIDVEDAEDELEEDVFLEDDSDLVNEVARRVASRLMSAKRSNSRRPRRRK